MIHRQTHCFIVHKYLPKHLPWLLMLSVSSCIAAPPQQQTHFAYITNQGENTVSVINTSTQQVIKKITVGKGPVGVAVSSKLKRAYITNVDSQTLSIIDTQRNQVIDTILIKGSPVGVALAPNQSTLYIADWFDNRIVALNTKSHTSKTLGVGKAPAGLVVSPDSKTLYVANRDSNDIAVINTATLQIVKRITVGKHPFGLALSPDGKLLASVNVQDDTISLIKLPHGEQSILPVRYHPYCAAFTANGETLYVTNTQDDSVSVIDITSKKITATINVGSTPEGISVDDANHRAYTANWGSNDVSVIDTQTNQRIANIPSGDKSRAFGQFLLK